MTVLDDAAPVDDAAGADPLVSVGVLPVLVGGTVTGPLVLLVCEGAGCEDKEIDETPVNVALEAEEAPEPVLVPLVVTELASCCWIVKLPDEARTSVMLLMSMNSIMKPGPGVVSWGRGIANDNCVDGTLEASAKVLWN